MRKHTRSYDSDDELRLVDYVKMLALEAVAIMAMFVLWLNSPI